MLINERFKSPNKEFEKVFNLFRKKDYFDEKSQAKKKQEEFVRFLKKGDPMATKVFKQNKEDMKSSLSFIEDMVMDYNKKNHFEAFQIFSSAVNDIEMKDSKSAEKSGNFIKSKIHNNSQKYSLAIYSAIRKQKFNNYKDVHKDVDELISKNESVKEATFRPNSGTMSGGTYGLDKRKYELKRDVKGVQIGDYTNVTLPKGTIIYNLPGGVFAHHRSLKSYEAGMNKYFNKPTFRGISIRREKNVILSIEKNSKILESVNEGKKRFKRQDGIGKAKYTVSYHDGKKKHKDGSDFFDIKIFKNKKDLSDFVGTLAKQGYKLTRESVNEAKYKVGDNVTVTLKGGKKVYKGKVEKINPLRIRTSPSDVTVLGNHMIQSVVNEASIKGRNNKTGESFGMVIGSDKKNKEGEFEVTIRISYSSRISSYKFMFDKGGNLIAIKDYGYSMDGKFPDMKGGGSVKSVKPNPRETITQIAKVTSPAFAKKIVQHVKKVNESVNEGLKSNDMYTMLDIAAGYSSTQDQAAGQMWSDEQDLYDYLKSDHIPKKYHKKFHKDIKRRFKNIKESVNEAISRSYYLEKYGANDEFSGKKVATYSKFDKNKIKSDFNRFAKTLKDEEELHFMGVNTDKKRSGDDYLFSVVNQDGKNRIEITKGSRTFYKPFKSFKLESVNEDKKQIKDLVKKVKHEKLFYDVLDTMEKKYGKRQYRIWLEKSLKDFGVNPKHYDYRTNAGAEEKLFQLGK